MLGQGLLGSVDGTMPFTVICDTSNNPLSRTSLGYVQSDAQVQYQSINERFIVNVEGGRYHCIRHFQVVKLVNRAMALTTFSIGRDTQLVIMGPTRSN